MKKFITQKIFVFILFTVIYGGGVFLTGCKNTAEGGVSSGGGPRNVSSTNILGKTGVSINPAGDTLENVLKKAGFVDTTGKFIDEKRPVDSDSGKKFSGVLVKNPDGTTKYVAVSSDGTLNPTDVTVQDGVKVEPVFGTVKAIKINIDGNIIEVPVPVTRESDNPTLRAVQDALNEQGIKLELTKTSANNPKCPDPSYNIYIGVAKTAAATTGLDESTEITESDTIYPVFQKNVTSKVNISGVSGGDVNVPLTATYGDEASKKITVEKLLKAANNNTTPSEPSQTGKTFAGWKVTKPDGSTEVVQHANIGTTSVPVGSTIAPNFIDPTQMTKNVVLNVPGSEPITVSLTVPTGTTSVTWAAIKAAGGAAVTNPTAPAGTTGYTSEWQTSSGTTPVPEDTPISLTGDSGVQLVWKKNISFTVNYGGASNAKAEFEIVYNNPETKTLNEILTKATVDKDTNHVDGNKAIVVPPKKKFKDWTVDGASITGPVAAGKTVMARFEDNTARFNVKVYDQTSGTPRNIAADVPVDVGSTTATWAEVMAASEALKEVRATGATAGYTLKWLNGITPVTTSSIIAQTDVVEAKFEKEVSYKVYFGQKNKNLSEAKFTITYPATKAEKTVYEIFNKTGKTSFQADDVEQYISRVFTGWKVSYKDTSTPEYFFTADTIDSSNTVKYASDAVACFYADYAAFKGNIGGMDGVDATAVVTSIGNIFVANTEVTQKQWHTVMSEIIPAYPTRNGGYREADANKPMVDITWYDAVAFCNYLTKRENRVVRGSDNFENAVYYVEINGVREYNPGKWGDVPEPNTGTGAQKWQTQLDSTSHWNYIKIDETKLGYRLPKLTEWFEAAHGGIENKYPKYSGTSGTTVNDLKKVAWYGGNSDNLVHDVNTKQDNASPIKDMTGNAWELCWGDADEFGNVKDKGYNAGPKVGGAAKATAEACDLTTNPKDTGASKKSSSADTGFRIVADQPK